MSAQISRMSPSSSSRQQQNLAASSSPASGPIAVPTASGAKQQRQALDTSDGARAAAQNLAHPRERGSLRYAYRRSVMSLSGAIERLLPGSTGGASGSSSSQRQSEREPLLAGNGDDERGQSGPSGAGAANYGSITDVPPEQRVPKPKPVKSPVRVEAKVWFANERTWISWLRVSLLIGTFSIAMYNSAAHVGHARDPVPPGNEPGPVYPSPSAGMIRNFAVVYALIAVLTLSWGLFNYHRRVHLIRTKFPGNFDDLIGPPVICAAMFIAVLVNFLVRMQQHLNDEGQ